MAFLGFELQTIHVDAGDIRLRVGGNDPPVVLLHGHPRTHMTWGTVADLLAPSFTVVCPDLPGFGRSYVPPDSPDSRHSSKEAKATALVELMGRLGHDKFSLVGHDRGSLTAFRMAMNYPQAVRELILHGMIEDYRAGSRIDHLHDKADRDAGRKVRCPLLCLWSVQDDQSSRSCNGNRELLEQMRRGPGGGTIARIGCVSVMTFRSLNALPGRIPS